MALSDWIGRFGTGCRVRVTSRESDDDFVRLAKSMERESAVGSEGLCFRISQGVSRKNVDTDIRSPWPVWFRGKRHLQQALSIPRGRSIY